MFGEDESENTIDVLPEGKYSVTLDRISLDETGKHPLVNSTFKVLDTVYKNRLLWKRFYFSEGTAKKFLPWQMGILGIKKDLDEMNCDSFQSTARGALDLLGAKIGNNYVVDVKHVEGNNGTTYNDLIVVESIADSILVQAAHLPDGLPNAALKVDEEEELPF